MINIVSPTRSWDAPRASNTADYDGFIFGEAARARHAAGKISVARFDDAHTAITQRV